MLSLLQLLTNLDVLPTQLGTTTSSSKTDKVPSRPFHLQPADNNQDTNPRQMLARKSNTQHGAPI
ncbi:MAG: hypothetical protein ACKPKO_43625, partial [Candidatus Fonsibacter sp.]